MSKNTFEGGALIRKGKLIGRKALNQIITAYGKFLLKHTNVITVKLFLRSLI